MLALRQDFVYALRTLLRSPGYALVTVLTLALGIGANAAIFSVVNGVMLKPLAYPDPGRLVFITSQFPKLGFTRFWMSTAEFLEFKERNRSFENVGAYREGSVNLGAVDRPRRVNSAIVTPELLPVLGVQPLRGRVFTAADSVPGAENVAILSSETWQSDFGGDETVLNRVIPIDGVATRVVGIMPPGYDIHDERVEIWQPLTIDPARTPTTRSNHFLYSVGRLRSDVTLARAHADLETMLAQWKSLNPSGHTPNQEGHRLQMQLLKTDLVSGIGTALWVLQGAVGFVLLIACANLANLLLARAESRQREFAIRSALGAGRWRLLRQFLTEGVVLALIGGVIGAAVGFSGLRGLLAANADSIPRAVEIALDWRVVLFTTVISILTGLVFGMAPLLHLREQVVSVALKDGGQRTTTGSARTRVRNGLVTAEVALAVVLVVGAGLLLRSFQKLMEVDPGFNRTHLITLGIVLPDATYQKPQSKVDFFDRLVDRLAQLPGVTGAAAMSGLPPNREVDANDTDFESYTAPKEGPFENVDYYQTVTPAYLTTMGIPVVQGRDFAPADATGAPVVLVNETLVKTFYKDRPPLGQRLRIGFSDKVPWFTIVGVVRDVKQGGMAAKTGTEVYFLNEQAPRIADFASGAMNVVIRSTRSAESVAPEARDIVRTMDPTLPIVKLRTMEQVFADSAARPRFLAELLAIFAGLALALAAVGTYGILSYSVSERTREIGIHMALGATRGSILGLVLGQGLRLTIVGLIGGLAAATVLTRLLQAQLFNVSSTDPVTLTAVAGFIGLVALVACYVPARRATRVDPMVTLRNS